ncbi:hypothetical protein MTO96_018471 [Rhipicephalus appendiculatus]
MCLKNCETIARAFKTRVSSRPQDGQVAAAAVAASAAAARGQRSVAGAGQGAPAPGTRSWSRRRTGAPGCPWCRTTWPSCSPSGETTRAPSSRPAARRTPCAATRRGGPDREAQTGGARFRFNVSGEPDESLLGAELRLFRLPEPPLGGVSRRRRARRAGPRLRGPAAGHAQAGRGAPAAPGHARRLVQGMARPGRPPGGAPLAGRRAQPRPLRAGRRRPDGRLQLQQGSPAARAAQRAVLGPEAAGAGHVLGRRQERAQEGPARRSAAPQAAVGQAGARRLPPPLAAHRVQPRGLERLDRGAAQLRGLLLPRHVPVPDARTPEQHEPRDRAVARQLHARQHGARRVLRAHRPVARVAALRGRVRARRPQELPGHGRRGVRLQVIIASARSPSGIFESQRWSCERAGRDDVAQRPLVPCCDDRLNECTHQDFFHSRVKHP